MEKTFNEQQFEGLQSADTYIMKLINGINIYFDYIKEEKDEEASNLLSYIVEGIDWLVEIARLTKDVQKGNMDEDAMNEHLNTLVQYFDEGSVNKVYKMLKEEILPLLREWKNIVTNSITL